MAQGLNTYALTFARTNLADRAVIDARATIRNMTAFTWQAWIKPGDNGNSTVARCWVERQGNTKQLLRFGVSPVNNKIRFALAPQDGKLATNYTYTFNWNDRWHHVAFLASISQETFKIMIDGQVVREGSLKGVGKDAANSNAILPISNTAPTAIYAGGYTLGGNSGWSYWDGKLDDVQLWDVVRAESDVLASMYEQAAIGASGLISTWRFNEGTDEGEGPLTTADSDNPTWTASLNHQRLWTVDRPFIGDGLLDTSPPSAPTSITIDPLKITSDGFTVSFGSSTDNVFVQYYEVEVSETNDFSSYVVYNTKRSLTQKIKGLLAGQPYYVRVRAFDAAGNASTYTTATGTPNPGDPHVTTLTTGDQLAPSKPNLHPITTVSYNSFSLSWDAVADALGSNPVSGTAGYRLDISRDSAFTQFLGNYTSLDVGNVLSVSVTGASPNTPYYARIRAYDVAKNESVPSDTRSIATLSLPDTSPPSIVELKTATNVESTSFIAQWQTGVDNIEVVGYRLDVSRFEWFDTPPEGVITDGEVTYVEANYNDLYVGNVLQYQVVGLNPDWSYWYRVRALDAAGNISANTDTPMLATTTPSLSGEGGLLGTTVEPAEDTYVDPANGTTVYGADEVLRASGDGTQALKHTLLRFQMDDAFAGTVQSASLRLWVNSYTTAGFSIYPANQPDETDFWDEDVVTYGTAPPYDPASPQPVTLTASGEWVDIDVTDMLLANATPYRLALALVTTGNGEIVFASKEDALGRRPQLEIEADPYDATIPLTASVTAVTDVSLTVTATYSGDGNENNTASLSYRALPSEDPLDFDDIIDPVAFTYDRTFKTITYVINVPGKPDTEFEIFFTFLDNEGIIGAEQFRVTAWTLPTPELPLTTGTLTLTSENDAINFVAAYTGDDADVSTALVQWKRNDLSIWSTTAHAYDRVNKQVTGRVGGLNAGTKYNLQVLFGGVTPLYGANPLLQTITTTTVGLTDEGSEIISFGGFVLNGSEDEKIYVTSLDGPFGTPNRRVEVEDLPRQHGAIQIRRLWGTRDIEIRGVVEGNDTMELQTNLEALKTALARGEQRLVIDTLSLTRRYYIATLKEFAAPQEAGRHYRHLEWTASLICADPFHYDQDETIDSFAASNGQVITVANDGSVDTYAMITFQPTVNSNLTVTLSNRTTGERMTPQVTISPGDKLVIDGNKQMVTKNGVSVEWLGSFPQLSPGTNTLAFKISPITVGSPPTTSTVLIEIRRRHRYL